MFRRVVEGRDRQFVTGGPGGVAIADLAPGHRIHRAGAKGREKFRLSGLAAEIHQLGHGSGRRVKTPPAGQIRRRTGGGDDKAGAAIDDDVAARGLQARAGGD